MKKIFIIVAVLLYCLPANAACPLNVSAGFIEKDYKFNGKNIEITGCKDKEQDIVLVVKGPARSYQVWKKERIYGVWVNGKSYTIPFTDSFFFISASKEIEKITDPATIKALNLDLDYRDFYILENYDKKDMEEFYDAFENYKKSSNHYASIIIPLEIKGDKFSTSVYIPTNSAAGTYSINVYKFENMRLSDQENISFKIEQDGVYTNLERMAATSPLEYAALAVFLALTAGILAGYLFRKRRKKKEIETAS